MKRIAAIGIGFALALGGWVLASGAGNGKAPTHYWLQLDNAFGLITGADFKVGGLRVGSIGEMKVPTKVQAGKPLLALVELRVDDQSGWKPFRQSVHCISRPQSTIGEYFVDCKPGTQGRYLKNGATIPVSHTEDTIPPDLVADVLRLPYRERLRIILDELGVALAGQGSNLSSALKRAVPALAETDKLLAILAHQNHVVANLVHNGDQVITALANKRTDVTRWVQNARDASQASAARRVELAGTWHNFPGFLAQLRPSMKALGRVADQQAPALRDLNAISGQLTRFFNNLKGFSNASTPAFKSLGKASVTGKKVADAGKPAIRQLGKFSAHAPELGQNLAIILNDLNDYHRAAENDPRAAKASGNPNHKGYSGIEALLRYVWSQSMGNNIFDSNQYILKVDLTLPADCLPYRNAESLKHGDKPINPSDPTSPTSNQLIKECAATTGPNQPGINQPDPTATPAAQAAASRQARDANIVATAVAHGQAGSGRSGGKRALPPIDLQRTIRSLLGRVTSGLPGLPNLPGLPKVNLPTKNSPPPSAQDAKQLLNYLLSP